MNLFWPISTNFVNDKLSTKLTLHNKIPNKVLPYLIFSACSHQASAWHDRLLGRTSPSDLRQTFITHKVQGEKHRTPPPRRWHLVKSSLTDRTRSSSTSTTNIKSCVDWLHSCPNLEVKNRWHIIDSVLTADFRLLFGNLQSAKWRKSFYGAVCAVYRDCAHPKFPCSFQIQRIRCNVLLWNYLRCFVSQS